jgi:hypothetical protein
MKFVFDFLHIWFQKDSKTIGIMDACVDLAKNLTAQYWSTSLYNVAQPLSEYLADTGVLVSVCMMESCFDTRWDDSMDFWSGSWLQHGTTGPRIFGGGGIGMVIDGKVAADDIMCLYPLDGMTMDRSKAGCGPIDAIEEMGWFGRFWVFARAYWTKLRWFGVTTRWDDIPCTKFMFSFYTGESPSTDDDDNLFFDMPAMLDHGGTWGTTLGVDAKLVGLVLHHSCCFDDSVPDFQDEAMLAYAGEEPWSPWQWNDNADMTKTVIEQHSASDGIWNEIVMKNLTSQQDLKDRVQAIFYTDEEDSYQARTEAEQFGGIPLLKMDVSQPKTLFTCAPKVVVATDHGFRVEEQILRID